MQQIHQRTARATRSAAKKLAKQRDHTRKGESWDRYQSLVRTQRSTAATVRDARANRRADWEAGALLAPRRDGGEQKDTYGALTLYELHPPDVEPRRQPKWAGISEGDRVVVLKGREKGKIGVVEEVNVAKASVRIKGLNRVEVVVPEWMNREDGSTARNVVTDRFQPLADVRLVYPLPDPATGVPRDVMVERLVHVNYRFDKDKREWTEGDRLIPGTNTLVPWPEKAEPTFVDHEDDTLRITVEHATFRPYLLHPPMPASVIDELRNKYSKFRTRHDWEFVEKKALEDERELKRKELVKSVRTPLQELADVRRERKAGEDRELSEQQMVGIGEVIARERARATRVMEKMGAR
ncbi:hypothetical protein LTR08_007055 [Meristemomyces frigidus]|nr:hypothetical protein LTR08_007055 [Meristemomyces frigidus]